MDKNRCAWAKTPLETEYHDKEWGVPVHDDHELFEFLLLEYFQAGLSWLSILKKRENFRVAFDQFNYKKIAHYSQDKISELLSNEGIIRNRRKIDAAVQNARVFIDIQSKYGSFDNYIWSFVNHQPIINEWKSSEQVPAKTALSDTISKDMKSRGFVFFGSTICYAYMQAIGMVNDHTTDCFRYSEINQMIV
jgi:DNA-3-methyladenine glycosylase I